MQNAAKYKVPKAGIGSFFHTIDPVAYDLQEKVIDFDYALFYTGRHALLYILKEIQLQKKIRKIWMPSYYCQHVTQWIQHSYDTIEFYTIDPFNFPVKWNPNEFASADDIVITNNYWGLSDSITKQDVHAILVEDHSHGWLTESCLHSKADYCFASLRKSLPIPLGGIVWKPGSSMNLDKDLLSEDQAFYNNWTRIQCAMNDKWLFVNGDERITKENFLQTIAETENFLHEHHSLVTLAPGHHELINNFVKYDMLLPKKRNLLVLTEVIQETDFIKVVKKENRISFGLSLLLKNEEYYQSLRKYLIENQIFPSHLWPGNAPDFKWNHFLNIHVDFRYSEEDMKYIVKMINNWIVLNK